MRENNNAAARPRTVFDFSLEDLRLAVHRCWFFRKQKGESGGAIGWGGILLIMSLNWAISATPLNYALTMASVLLIAAGIWGLWQTTPAGWYVIASVLLLASLCCFVIFALMPGKHSYPNLFYGLLTLSGAWYFWWYGGKQQTIENSLNGLGQWRVWLVTSLNNAAKTDAGAAPDVFVAQIGGKKHWRVIVGPNDSLLINVRKKRCERIATGDLLNPPITGKDGVAVPCGAEGRRLEVVFAAAEYEYCKRYVESRLIA